MTSRERTSPEPTAVAATPPGRPARAERASGPEAPRARRRRLALVVLVAIVAHLGIGAGGVWSFEPLNYDDPQVLALARTTPVSELLTGPVWYAYKPVYFLSLKVDALFGDAAVAVGHVQNLLLHALAALLLVLVLEGWLRSRWLATAAGLLFAAHPVHVESVAWIASRKDVLSLVLVLAAHLAYVRTRRRGGVALLAAVLFALAGLAKGTVWVWAGVLLLDEALHRARERAAGRPAAWRAAIVRWLPIGVVAVLGVGLDLHMAVTYGPGAVEHGVSLGALAAAAMGVHLHYLENVLVPVRLALDYGVSPAGTWLSPGPWLGLLALAGAVVGLVLSLRRGFVPGAVAAGVWILGWLPVNAIWPRTAILMADRYLYVPAIGVYVLAAVLLLRLRSRAVVLGALVVVLGVLASVRTATFRDAATVWRDATSKEPQSALAWFQSGHAEASLGRWAAATTDAENAIALAPRPEILVKSRLLELDAMLGGVGASGTAPDATTRATLERHARDTIELARSLRELPIVRQDAREVVSEAYVRLGQVLELQHDPAGALDAYAQAVRSWGESAVARHDLATLLLETHAEDALPLAEGHLRVAVRCDPDFLDARLQLAHVLALEGRVPDALNELRRAEARTGPSPDLLFAEAQVYLAGPKNAEKAQEILKRLTEWWPNHPKGRRLLSDIHMAYANGAYERGKARRDTALLREALARYDQALAVTPHRWEAEVGAGDVLLELARFDEARARYTRAADESDGPPWVRRLVADAALLEAAWRERGAKSDDDHREAARLARLAIHEATGRLDLGLLPLAEELDWFRAAIDEGTARRAPEVDALCRAAALAVVGDESGAVELDGAVLERLATGTPAPAVFDAAILLRALLRDRAGRQDDAGRDYRLLMDRRPDDPLVRLRLLAADLRAAKARLSIAEGQVDDPKGLRLAQRAAETAARALSQHADDHPDLVAAGLLAAETEMQQQRWVEALRRLNDLRERHPREPAVLRGQAAVYVAEYFSTRAREALDEAVRTLTKALLLDPRDPRTWLDASGVARVAGDLASAIRHAERARAYEWVPDGTAARTLSDLQVAIGRQALERGDTKTALAQADRAEAAASGRAEPWMLRGDVYQRLNRVDDAFTAWRTARELEPASVEVGEGLAKIHRDRALRFRLLAMAEREPPPPPTTGPDGTPLSADELGAATKAWEAKRRLAKARKDAYLKEEKADLEAALRLAPHVKESDDVRSRLANLEDQDPDARRKAWFDAEAAVDKGEEERQVHQPALALADFERAIDLWPDHARAHYLLVATAYDLLRVGAGTGDEAERDESHWINAAFASLQALDQLDRTDRLYDRHRYRGLLNELLLGRSKSEAMRVAAERAYRRYLDAARGAGVGEDDANLRFVEERLRGLGGP